MSSLTRELEEKVQLLFTELKTGFGKVETLPAGKQQAMLKDLTVKMQEAKRLIKEFEREARMDGMPVPQLAIRKKQLVQELNGFIAKKKALSEQAEGAPASTTGRKGSQSVGQDAMSTAQLIQLGKKEIASTDQALVRAQKVVADTIEIGTKTAETLDSQTKQLERVMDDLDEIQFTMQKAKQVIRDMTRSMATDKCIRFMLLVVILGAIALVALRIAGVGALGKKNPAPPRFGISPPPSGRRLLIRHNMSPSGVLPR